MPTPCYGNPKFHGTPTEQASVKHLCDGCPVKDICLELGLGERDGVYGGTMPLDSIRRSFRKTVDRKTCCPNGHPKEEYGTVQEGWGHRDVEGCTYCAGLQLTLLERAS